MRASSLCAVLLLATLGCDLEFSSLQFSKASATDQTNGPGAPLRPVSQENRVRGCGDMPERASDTDALHFLTQAAGVWRDHLAGVIVVQNDDGEKLIQEGLAIGPETLFPVDVLLNSKVNVADSEEEFTPVGIEPKRRPTHVRVGTPDADGYREIRLIYGEEKSDSTIRTNCEVYAIKLEPMKRGREGLLVRGPLNRSAVADVRAQSIDLSDETSRVFIR